MQVNGAIEQVTTKNGTSKAGKPFSIYYYVVNGVPVKGGFKAEHRPGDAVNWNIEQDKYGEWVRTLGGSGSTLGASTVLPNQPATVSTFPIPISSKEQAIIRQSALKAAVDLYVGCSPLNNAGISDEAVEQIITTAYKFAEFSSGQREVRIVKEGGLNGPTPVRT